MTLKITHDGIELGGEIIADFRASFPSYKRRELRDNLDEESNNTALIEDGFYTLTSEYQALDSEADELRGKVVDALDKLEDESKPLDRDELIKVLS